MPENDLQTKAEDLASLIASLDSPTLKEVALNYRRLLPRQPFPVCVNCPNSLWQMISPHMLQCYCRVISMTSWASDDQNPMLFCDGLYIDENAGSTTNGDGEEEERMPQGAS